jgi:hypothetical protein
MGAYPQLTSASCSTTGDLSSGPAHRSFGAYSELAVEKHAERPGDHRNADADGVAKDDGVHQELGLRDMVEELLAYAAGMKCGEHDWSLLV